MVGLFKTITEFNTVRFSAYRTAMKLREVQKTLGRKLSFDHKCSDIFKETFLHPENQSNLLISLFTISHPLFIMKQKCNIKIQDTDQIQEVNNQKRIEKQPAREHILV